MTESTNSKPVILEVNNLKKFFPIQKGFFKRVVGQVRAVDDVSFFINEGETLGLVGESGCGKTTTARCILRAVDPSAGEILFQTSSGEKVDIATLSDEDMRVLRSEIQLIFQDPYASLNPRHNIFDIVGEPLFVIQQMTNRAERQERVTRTAAAGRAASRIHAAFSACLQRWPKAAHRHRPRSGLKSTPDRR